MALKVENSGMWRSAKRMEMLDAFNPTFLAATISRKNVAVVDATEKSMHSFVPEFACIVISYISIRWNCQFV